MHATDAATAREKLHHIIDEIEDECVIGLYVAFSNEIEEEDWEYPAELKAQLNKVEDDIKNGRKENFITEDELHNRISELLKK